MESDPALLPRGTKPMDVTMNGDRWFGVIYAWVVPGGSGHLGALLLDGPFGERASKPVIDVIHNQPRSPSLMAKIVAIALRFASTSTKG